VVTVLYLVSVAAWYAFSEFEGATQIAECSQLKQHIEQNFAVEATCVSRGEHVLIQDTKVYSPILASTPYKLHYF